MNRIVCSVVSVMLFGIVGCGVDAESPTTRPISADEVAQLAGDGALDVARATLASDGYRVALEDGVVHRLDDRYAAVFPVESADGGACEYRSLTYQETGGDVFVFVERDGDATVSASAKAGTDHQNFSCTGWGGWVSKGGSECRGSFPSCAFEGFIGTYERQERKRRCCDANGKCWDESEFQDSLKRCGC